MAKKNLVKFEIKISQMDETLSRKSFQRFLLIRFSRPALAQVRFDDCSLLMSVEGHDLLLQCSWARISSVQLNIRSQRNGKFIDQFGDTWELHRPSASHSASSRLPKSMIGAVMNAFFKPPDKHNMMKWGKFGTYFTCDRTKCVWKRRDDILKSYERKQSRK